MKSHHNSIPALWVYAAFSTNTTQRRPHAPPRAQNEMKIFAEATLGNTVDNSRRASFIKYDRNVLRFQAVWDDRESLYGDVQRFEVESRYGC